jgi:hypothetical protein
LLSTTLCTLELRTGLPTSFSPCYMWGAHFSVANLTTYSPATWMFVFLTTGSMIDSSFSLCDCDGGVPHI